MQVIINFILPYYPAFCIKLSNTFIHTSIIKFIKYSYYTDKFHNPYHQT